MTLHILTEAHIPFLVACYRFGGMEVQEALQEAKEIVAVSGIYEDPIFFVGPNAKAPRYFFGAYVTADARAQLVVGTVGQLGAAVYVDATDWLAYMLNTLEITLLEAYVWVKDLQKEWLLRALGFRKSGMVPDRVDIPNVGSANAVSMFIRMQEFNGVTPETFRATLKKYQRHNRRGNEKDLQHG